MEAAVKLEFYIIKLDFSLAYCQIVHIIQKLSLFFNNLGQTVNRAIRFDTLILYKHLSNILRLLS